MRHLRRQSCLADVFQLLKADHAAGQFVECLPRGAGAFITLVDASEVGEPTDGPLDWVSHFSKAAAVRDRMARRRPRGQQRSYATLDHLANNVLKAVRCITDHRFGPIAWRSGPGHLHRRHRIEHRQKRHLVPDVGRGAGNQQRHAIGIDNYVPFTAVFRTIDRAWPGVRAPFFARTLAESTTTVSSSICPALPSRFSNLRCSCGQTPARIHSVKRRQQVLPLGHRSLAGSICHWQPVRSTYAMPSMHLRSSTRGAPPRGSGRCVGSKGLISFQRSSGTNGSAMGQLPCYLLPTTPFKIYNTKRMQNHRHQL
jgi:hypothetical protein